ncbi:hypothetical protein ACWCW7_14865 [Nocardia tengchongensis]
MPAPRPKRIGLGHRGPWTLLLAGIIALGLLEAAVLHLLARAFLPATAATCVDVLAGTLTLAVILAFASPLWGSITLTPTTFRLRFGVLASATIGITNIAAARTKPPNPRHPAELGLDFDNPSALLSIIRSPKSPLLQLDLHEPISVRTQGWRRVHASSVLTSVSDPTPLLTAFESG